MAGFVPLAGLVGSRSPGLPCDTLVPHSCSAASLAFCRCCRSADRNGDQDADTPSGPRDGIASAASALCGMPFTRVPLPTVLLGSVPVTINLSARESP